MFVPVVPPFAASSRARDLARRLTESIESYRQANPDLKPWEIEAALRLAAHDTDRLRRAKFAVVLGLVAMGGLVALFLSRSETAPAGVRSPAADPAQPAWILGILVGILAVAAAAALFRRR